MSRYLQIPLFASRHQSSYLIDQTKSERRNSVSRMNESYSTQTSCQLIKSKVEKSKFYSFKSIKEQRIQDKNQTIKIVKKIVPSADDKSKIQIQSLDEAVTIKSQSSRSSVNLKEPSIEESIIVFKGGNLFENDKQNDTVSFLHQDFTSNHEAIQRIPHMTLDLGIMMGTGILTHFEICQKQSLNIYFLEKIKVLNSQSVLSLYQMKYYRDKSCILFFEPYESTFINYLIKSKTVNEFEFILYLIDLLSITKSLCENQIEADITMEKLVLVNKSLKIKIREESERTRTYLQQCGKVGKELLNLVKYKTQNQSKIEEIRTALEEFENNTSLSTEEAELNLQVLKYN